MFKNTLKIAWRHLLRQPLFSFINITGFALGIACAFVGLQYAWQELSYDKNYEKGEQIYRVGVDFMGMGGLAISPEILVKYVSANAPEVEAASRVRGGGKVLIKHGERSMEVKAIRTDSSFFNLFDFPFTEGNAMSALDAPDEVIISEEFATTWFGIPSVVGQSIKIGEEEKEYIIGGVVRNGNRRSHLRADLWIPIYQELDNYESWTSARFFSYFLLKDGVTKQAFEKRLDQIVEEEIFPRMGVTQAFDEWLAGENAYRFIVQPLADIYLKSNLRMDMGAGGNEAKVWGFLIIGLFILIVAIVNYINLITAQSMKRSREVGVKKAIGADRNRLVGQFLMEALVFGGLAATFALGFAELLQLGFQNITAEILLDQSIFQFKSIALFYLFSFGVSALAGLYPAFVLTAYRPIQMLKGTSQLMPRRNRFSFYLRSSLVVLQFVIAGGMMISSMVIWRQLHYMSNKDLGFDRSEVLVVYYFDALEDKMNSFRSQLEAFPQVMSSAISQSIPAGENVIQTTFQTPEMANPIPLRTFPTDHQFLKTMGMQLKDGSNFPERLQQDTSIALLTEKAVEVLNLKEPIGAKINQGQTVIGVVKNFHIEGLHHGIEPLVFTHALEGSYLCLKMNPNLRGASLSSFMENLEQLWTGMLPNQKLHYAFLDESFEQLARQDEIQGKSILALTLLAIFISCLGLFALAIFSAEQRTKEIGIRKVLGASTMGLVRLLTKDFLSPVLIALLLALPLAFVISSEYLKNFAYRVIPEWWVYAIPVLLAILIALATVSFQSIRAARANPAENLKDF